MKRLASVLISMIFLQGLSVSAKERQTVDVRDIKQCTLTQEQADKLINNLYDMAENQQTTASASEDIYHYLTSKDYDSAFAVCSELLGKDSTFLLYDRRYLRGNSYGWNPDAVKYYEVFYRCMDTEYPLYETAMQNFEEIRNGISRDASDAEKILYYHDYIASHYTYCTEAALRENLFLESFMRYHTPLAPLTEEAGICEGFAALYNCLLNEDGVTCYIVDSTELEHSWNMVSVDGKWRFVDTTWDLTPAGEPVNHTYYCLSYDDMYHAGHNVNDWKLSNGYSVEEFLLKKENDALEQGDVNGDGYVSQNDLVYLHRYLTCVFTGVPRHIVKGDMDGDGEVDIFDLALLKRKVIWGA